MREAQTHPASLQQLWDASHKQSQFISLSPRLLWDTLNIAHNISSTRVLQSILINWACTHKHDCELCLGFPCEKYTPLHTHTLSYRFFFKKRTIKGENYPTVGLISISVLLIKLKLSKYSFTELRMHPSLLEFLKLRIINKKINLTIF